MSLYVIYVICAYNISLGLNICNFVSICVFFIKATLYLRFALKDPTDVRVIFVFFAFHNTDESSVHLGLLIREILKNLYYHGPLLAYSCLFLLYYFGI